MARRYDGRTTIFSPEGRLYQVEYAMEAISHAGTAIGVLSKEEGIVLAAEKKTTGKLLEHTSFEKLYAISEHMACAVAGITSDANLLISHVRTEAQRYLFQYNEEIAPEHLVQVMCDLKQGYTQYGGLRPFGVSFLYAGHDERHGFQLYHSDPSGNYAGWKATTIGANSANATAILKQDMKEEGLSMAEAQALAIKVLNKTLDATMLTADKLEFGTLDRHPTSGAVRWRSWSTGEIDALLKEQKVGPYAPPSATAGAGGASVPGAPGPSAGVA